MLVARLCPCDRLASAQFTRSHFTHVMIDETSTPIYRVKTAFLNSIYATIGSIVLGFGFKIWLAQWVPKTNLALYHSTVDVVTLSLILLTGFRSSMVVSYSQSKNDRDITNIFRLCLISAVLIVWGVVLPYFRHKHGVSIEYSYMVSIILGMGLKIYFTKQTFFRL